MLRLAAADKSIFAKPIEQHEYTAHTIRYFEKTLADESLIAWVAETNGRIVGLCSVMPVYGVPVPANPSGLVWQIVEMIDDDDPDLTVRFLETVIALATEYGTEHIAAYSMPDAVTLYEKADFRLSTTLLLELLIKS